MFIYLGKNNDKITIEYLRHYNEIGSLNYYELLGGDIHLMVYIERFFNFFVLSVFYFEKENEKYKLNIHKN